MGCCVAKYGIGIPQVDFTNCIIWSSLVLTPLGGKKQPCVFLIQGTSTVICSEAVSINDHSVKTFLAKRAGYILGYSSFPTKARNRLRSNLKSITSQNTLGSKRVQNKKIPQRWRFWERFKLGVPTNLVLPSADLYLLVVGFKPSLFLFGTGPLSKSQNNLLLEMIIVFFMEGDA